MNTDARQQIQTALQAFSGADLRAASIALLNSLDKRGGCRTGGQPVRNSSFRLLREG